MTIKNTWPDDNLEWIDGVSWREVIEEIRANRFRRPEGWPPTLPVSLYYGSLTDASDWALIRPESDNWPRRGVVRVDKRVAVLRAGWCDYWYCDEEPEEYASEEAAETGFWETHRRRCALATEWAAEEAEAEEDEIDPEDIEAWAERYADYY